MGASTHQGCNPDIITLLSTYLGMRSPGMVGEMFDSAHSVHVLTLRQPHLRTPVAARSWTQLRISSEVCERILRADLLRLLADPLFTYLLDVEPCVEIYVGAGGVAAREAGAAPAPIDLLPPEELSEIGEGHSALAHVELERKQRLRGT